MDISDVSRCRCEGRKDRAIPGDALDEARRAQESACGEDEGAESGSHRAGRNQQAAVRETETRGAEPDKDRRGGYRAPARPWTKMEALQLLVGLEACVGDL